MASDLPGRPWSTGSTAPTEAAHLQLYQRLLARKWRVR